MPKKDPKTQALLGELHLAAQELRSVTEELLEGGPFTDQLGARMDRAIEAVEAVEQRLAKRLCGND